MKRLFRRHSIAALQAEAHSDERLRRALGPVNLTALGVGAIVGTGIFVMTGTVAAQNAGPAVVLSFALAGVASVFAALCYSEFAALVPVAGSAYTYSYATLGEIFAWIIGWDLILEYAVGAIAVAIGWSGYVVSFLHSVGLHLAPELSAARGTELVEVPAALAATLRVPAGWQVFGADFGRAAAAAGTDPATLAHTTAVFNLPAVLIVFIVTSLLVVGIKESAAFNNGIVVVKLAVVLLFIVGAAFAIKTANWHPFIPRNTGAFGHFGWSGVLRGASIAFFAYIGFDAVSTAAQEAKNPQRDMPIGIISSLCVCTVLYILVSGIATGVMPYTELDVPDPIALAADRAAMGLTVGGVGLAPLLIKLGAIAGLSSVIMVMLLGQSRVFYSMSRDGLLPPFVSRVHPRFKTPWLTSIVTGGAVSFFAAILPISDAVNLCSIGTLLAFVIVCTSVLVLRLREPHHHRAFKAPAVWFVAPAGALSSLALMGYLPWLTWRRLIVWFLIGMVVYILYGQRHSKLHRGLLTKVEPQDEVLPQ
jgi:APA family basic amino acid/polyamine antiporter